MASEHARAFADVPGVSLAGIHSRTRDRAAALADRFGIGDVCGSITELAERTSADLVVVAVSEVAALTTALECFEHPWTVLLEKPPGLNLPEAEAVLAAAGAAGRRVLVAMNRRFYSSTLAALHDLSGRQGPRFIHVQDQQDLVRDPGPHHPRAVRDNWMYANSIHLVDYLTAFGRGAVTSVTAVYAWEPAAPGVVVSRVDFSSGDRALYEAVWNAPGPWCVSVTCPEVRWEMRPLEDATSQLAGTRQRTLLPVHPRDREFKPGFRLQAQEAVAAARGAPSRSVPLEEAVRTMRLISEIYGAGVPAARESGLAWEE
jgi:predicted dehydrogenase